MDTDQVVKTVYAQYTVKDIEQKSFYIKYKRNERVSTVSTNRKLNDIGDLRELSFLKGYRKIKLIYTVINRETKERIDCDPELLAGRYDVCLIGLLVK